MRFEVGKQYWLVKEDGGIYDFLITKAIRYLNDSDPDAGKFIDNYYCNERKVIVDKHTNKDDFSRIFESFSEAADLRISELRKMIEDQGSF